MGEAGLSIDVWIAIPVLILTVAVVTVGLIATVGVSTAAASDGGNVTAYRVESASFTDAETIERAIANGTLEPAQKVVVGETIVVEIASVRLARNLSTGNGSATRRFFDHLEGPATFRMIQTNPSPQRNRLIGELGPNNVTVYQRGPTVYALIDTGELAFVYNRVRRSEEIYGGERFALEFGYHLDEHPLGRPYDSTGAVIELYPTIGEFSSIPYQYDVLAPEWVHRSVEVNLPPENSVSVRVFIHDTDRTMRISVSPEEYPDFTDLWIDLRDVDPGTGVTLELIHDGSVIDRQIGRITQPDATLSDVSIQTERNQTHVSINATLSHGGKIQVLREGCEEVGVERVDPGGPKLVTVDLWNDRGERIHVQNTSDYGITIRALREDGAPRAAYLNTDSSKVMNWVGPHCGYPSREPTPTITTTEASTDQETTDRSTTPSVAPTTPDQAGSETTMPDSNSETTASPGQPGFTSVGAIITVTILWFVARRRRR